MLSEMYYGDNSGEGNSLRWPRNEWTSFDWRYSDVRGDFEETT